MEEKLEGLELAHTLVDSIIDKKGSNILLLDISEEAVFTNYFLICSGDNERQIQALADSIAQDAKEEGNILPIGREGESSSGWVLLDYGELIVHIFSPNQRNYYKLEELWSQAHTLLHMQ